MVALSARFNVMESMEKRVRSRFSHRRDIIMELAAEDFDSPTSGPVALLKSLLSLPVSAFWVVRAAAAALHAARIAGNDLTVLRVSEGHQTHAVKSLLFQVKCYLKEDTVILMACNEPTSKALPVSGAHVAPPAVSSRRSWAIAEQHEVTEGAEDVQYFKKHSMTAGGAVPAAAKGVERRGTGQPAGW